MKEVISRVSYIYFIIFFAAMLVIGRIVQLQFFSTLEVSSDDISFRIEEIESVRGSVLARDGRSLASSVPYYQVRMRSEEHTV